MDKRSLKIMTWAFVLGTVLVIGLMLGGSLRRTAHITLPAEKTAGSVSGDELPSGEEDFRVVEVRPDTVQSAIATLSRLENYYREITVEQFWEGGSGTYLLNVWTDGIRTRTDRTMPDGKVRHVLSGREEICIWYDQETHFFRTQKGNISEDEEQTVPTYEDILQIPLQQIAAADFRSMSGIDCIYTETGPDAAGYVNRYWVALDTGLLTAAERLLNGETVYRMAARQPEEGKTTGEDLQLPDGSQL